MDSGILKKQARREMRRAKNKATMNKKDSVQYAIIVRERARVRSAKAAAKQAMRICMADEKRFNRAQKTYESLLDTMNKQKTKTDKMSLKRAAEAAKNRMKNLEAVLVSAKSNYDYLCADVLSKTEAAQQAIDVLAEKLKQEL